MRSMSILEEMLEMFATTVQAELKATLHVCESGIFLGLVPKESPCISYHIRELKQAANRFFQIRAVSSSAADTELRVLSAVHKI
jgi:hypothetical protein